MNHRIGILALLAATLVTGCGGEGPATGSRDEGGDPRGV